MDLGGKVPARAQTMPFALKPPSDRSEPVRLAGALAGLPFQAPGRAALTGNEDSVTFDASSLDQPEKDDFSSTRMSIGSAPPPPPSGPPRVIVTEPMKAAVPVQVKVEETITERPSIFNHDSPDSAPTRVLPLAPAPEMVRPKASWFNVEPPDRPSASSAPNPGLNPPEPAEEKAPAPEPPKVTAEPERRSAPPSDPYAGSPISDEPPPTVAKTPGDRISSPDFRNALYRRFKK